MVGYGGKHLQKRKVLSLEWKSEGVMDDESGESMEPMEEVPLIQLGEAELDGNRIKTSKHNKDMIMQQIITTEQCCGPDREIGLECYFVWCISIHF